jgi:hypothetical protein
MSDHAQASRFQRVLLTTQEYYIRVIGRSDRKKTYTMNVTIPVRR